MPHLSRSERWGFFLLGNVCDAKMHHMKKASVRDLRYRFSVVEDLLRDGEEIHITKRKRVIARLLPPDPVAPAAFPDFLARQKKTFGKKRLKVSGAERSEEHTSELQSRLHLVCRLLLEKKKITHLPFSLRPH